MRISGRPIKIRPEVAAAYRSNGTLWERLKAACPVEWDRYLQNDFIWHLADGSLSREAYRHFIVQDYFYLIHHARGTSWAPTNHSLSRACASSYRWSTVCWLAR